MFYSWRFGYEYNLQHDGLQGDGSLEARVEWKDGLTKHVVVLRLDPWLAYGCSEGARLSIRRPGSLEGRSGTVQRTLRDDSVVVRLDGQVVEATIDPTPHTVIRAANPRHDVGTRLLFVHEGSCVDATVMEWAAHGALPHRGTSH